MNNMKVFLATIIVAILGLIGTIYTANMGDPVRDPQFEATLEVQKTQTAMITPSSEVSLASTEISGENTESPPTSVWTPSAEFPGADWERGCVSSEIWDVYSSNFNLLMPISGNCYQLIEYGISAHQGNLAFVKNKILNEEIYGVLVRIPDNANIEFSLRVNELNNGDIWMGVVESPISRAGKYLVAKKDSYFDIIEIQKNFPSTVHENYHVQFHKNPYHFRFEIEGNQWNIWREGTPQAMYTDINITFVPRYFFIGYRAYSANGISGTVDVRISDLVIEER